VTGLTTLKLDGVDRVDPRSLAGYVGRLRFADLAMLWVGFQPKPRADSMIIAAEERNCRSQAALVVQCVVRRRRAYQAYREKRRWWLMATVLPRFQAIVRGYLQVTMSILM
jgi:hypothetical protein